MFLHPSFLPRASHNFWNSQAGQTQLVLPPVEELLQLAPPNAPAASHSSTLSDGDVRQLNGAYPCTLLTDLSFPSVNGPDCAGEPAGWPGGRRGSPQGLRGQTASSGCVVQPFALASLVIRLVWVAHGALQRGCSSFMFLISFSPSLFVSHTGSPRRALHRLSDLHH